MLGGFRLLLVRRPYLGRVSLLGLLCVQAAAWPFWCRWHCWPLGSSWRAIAGRCRHVARPDGWAEPGGARGSGSWRGWLHVRFRQPRRLRLQTVGECRCRLHGQSVFMPACICSACQRRGGRNAASSCRHRGLSASNSASGSRFGQNGLLAPSNGWSVLLCAMILASCLMSVQLRRDPATGDCVPAHSVGRSAIAARRSGTMAVALSIASELIPLALIAGHGGADIDHRESALAGFLPAALMISVITPLLTCLRAHDKNG